MRIAFDTNILVYAQGGNDPARRRIALDVMDALGRDSMHLPVQVLGELFNVLTRKARWPMQAARDAVLNWRSSFTLIAASEDTLLSALDLACDHQLAICDALVVSTAADADCRLLLSENMQDGFVWRGLTIVNPFASKRHPLLEAVLS